MLVSLTRAGYRWTRGQAGGYATCAVVVASGAGNHTCDIRRMTPVAAQKRELVTTALNSSATTPLKSRSRDLEQGRS